MKKSKKIISSILIIITLVFIWFYTKEPMEIISNSDIEHKMKFSPLYGDSCFVYIPYKMKIFNNRFKILALSEITDTQYLDEEINNLVYDYKGNEITNLRNREYDTGYEYYYKKYDRTIFPLCYKTLTFYKAYKIAKSEIIDYNEKINFDKYRSTLYRIDINLNYKISEKQKQVLYNMKDKKIVFWIVSQDGQIEYMINYYLNNMQKVNELKKMSNSELKNLMFKDIRK